MQRTPPKSLILTFTFCNINKIEFLGLFDIYTFIVSIKDFLHLGYKTFLFFPPLSNQDWRLVVRTE